MTERKYLPTFAELIDRMSICQLKSIFIPENKEAYDKEIQDIKDDLDMIVEDNNIQLTGQMIQAIQMIMLSNRFIWENESRVRAMGDDEQQEKLLKKTHSINGIRNNAKNVISKQLGERVDLKTDCLAASLIAELGNWNVDYGS